MGDAFVDACLRRLGVEARERADLARLRELHAAHLLRVPFENLSIHLGEPITLESDALADKILTRGRGGFCYELNGLFARLLDHLGYHVTLLGARVWTGKQFGPPLDHLLLMVATADGVGRWLADVGFGDNSVYPLPWRERVDLDDPGGVFRLEPADGDWDLYRDGAVQYRIEPHPRALAEFDAMCWYQQTSPASHFTRSLVCTRRTAEGRVTLSGQRLITTTADGKDEKDLADDDAVLDAYRTVFGIDLNRVPRVAQRADG
jgi:N-hydroxyarylamine O-acetyltransferase